MSGVQGGLGEQKRDILKLREEAKGLGLGHPNNWGPGALLEGLTTSEVEVAGKRL